MTGTMNLERFATIVDAYGAEPARWPDAERAAALALLLASTEARARREAASALDGLLATLPPARPSADLREAVLAAAPRRRGRAGLFGGLGWRPVGAALAASFLLGLIVGGVIDGPSATAADGSQLELAMLERDYGGY